jgi:hypothetical protein
VRRLVAAVALVLLAVPCVARAADGDAASPGWAAEIEERIGEAVASELGPEGLRSTATSVPLERTGLVGSEAARCRALRFYEADSQAHFTELLLCRWSPMGASIPPPEGIMLAAPLWTVTPTALVFGPWLGPDGVMADAALLERVTVTAAAALDVEALQAPCDDDPATTIPADVQLISAECHRHYVSLQIAMPGSRVPTDDELRALAPGKMVELWVMPDHGEVIHRWIAPPAGTGEADAMGSPGSPEDPGPEFAGPGPFGDYTAKDTPDTVVDYRGALAPRLKALPPETLEALPEMVLLLRRQQRQAMKNRGEWIDGNIILGADPREYVPSDDELIEAAIGERLARVVEANVPEEVRRTLHEAGVEVSELMFRSFTFRHVDVMGSGRFFYASMAEMRTVLFP